MTPQELIDLPYSGEAIKRVKAMGMWLETMTDTERIEWMDRNAATIDWLGGPDVNPEYDDGCFFDILRPAIDKAATKKTASDYERYK